METLVNVTDSDPVVCGFLDFSLSIIQLPNWIKVLNSVFRIFLNPFSPNTVVELV